VTSPGQLADRLGLPPETPLLVVCADQLGQAQSANEAVYESLRAGFATSAGLMIPCAWSREAAFRYRGEDVGVSLTLNSELEHYRWGPLTQAPSLLDGDGGFPRTVADLWDHADLDEIRRECRAQLERAILWGFDITHLDAHLGVMQQRPEFFDVLLDLAIDYRLPVCLPDEEAERAIGFPARQLAADEGILVPDQVVDLRGPGARQSFESLLFDLQPGVTAVHLRPAKDTPEVRALDPHWSDRVEHYLLVAHDASLRHLIDKTGAKLIGFRELRELQRSA
jgi:chitin disaccharide deacetylase